MDITSKSLFDCLHLDQKGAVHFGLNRLFEEGGTLRVALQMHPSVGPETSIPLRPSLVRRGPMISLLVNQ